MRKNLFLTIMLMFFVSTMMAQQVSVSEALSRATSFLQSQSSSSKASAKSGTVTSSDLKLAYTQHRLKDQKVCFYVFNRGANDGFVIMGGDDAAQTVLGYCDHGSFDYTKAPENFKWWLSQYNQQISDAIDYATANPQTVTTAKSKSVLKASANSNRKTVGPLILTKWNQGEPYYNDVNAAYQAQGGTKTFVTGCVATATAQVMYYHKWPKTTGTGSHNYTCQTNEDFSPSANFETTYNWDDMLTGNVDEKGSYGGSYNSDQAAAVAKLMYHVGVSVDMDYNESNAGGSGAVQNYLLNALTSYFGYDPGIRDEQRNYFTDDDWENMVYDELANGRPVIYGGQAANGSGHCFICDGYRISDGFFSFNWGWGSSCDGWYAITGTGKGALQPNGNGIGGAGTGAAYTGHQEIIIGIRPHAGGVRRPHAAEMTKGDIKLYVGGTNYTSYSYTKSTESTSATLKTTVYNIGTVTDLQMGVRAYDKNTGMVKYWACDNNVYLNTCYVTEPISLSFDLKDFEYNGTYEIQPVCREEGKTDDSDWTLLDAYANESLPTIVVSGGSTTEAQSIAFSLSSSNNEVQVGRSIAILHNSNYNGTVTYSGYDNSIVTVDDNGNITGVKEGTTTINVSGSEYSLNGTKLYNATTASFDVTVIPTEKTTPVVSISGTSIFAGNTATITIEGYDGSNIEYSSSATSVATVADGTVTGVAEGTAEITVKAPATTLCNAINTTFTITVLNNGINMRTQPYFKNDNNVYADDLICYIPFYNSASTTQNANIYCKLEVPSGTVCTLNGCTSFDLPSGYNTCVHMNLSGCSSVFTTGGCGQYTLYFYKDEDFANPWNYPSVTFNYRETLTHDYTLTSAGVGTLILPFDANIPTTDNSGNSLDWKAYKCTGIDEDNVLILAAESRIERNVPYIITGSTGTVTFAGPKAVDASPVLFGDGPLKGTMLNSYNFKDGDYILQKHSGEDAAFYKYNTSSGTRAASPYRAFIQTTSSMLNYVSIPGIGGTTTSINIVEANSRPAGIYSIDGVKRQTLQPGLNIVVDEQGNTRKMFIKK